jgi:hypothetical protein
MEMKPGMCEYSVQKLTCIAHKAFFKAAHKTDVEKLTLGDSHVLETSRDCGGVLSGKWQVSIQM